MGRVQNYWSERYNRHHDTVLSVLPYNEAYPRNKSIAARQGHNAACRQLYHRGSVQPANAKIPAENMLPVGLCRADNPVPA